MLKEEEQSSLQNIISNEDIAVTADVDTAPGKYHKRPHLAEAMLYNGNNINSIITWMKKTYEEHGKNFTPWCYNQKSLTAMIAIEDGHDVYLCPNHWMIFSHKKYFYVLPSDIFEDTYEVHDA